MGECRNAQPAQIIENTKHQSSQKPKQCAIEVKRHIPIVNPYENSGRKERCNIIGRFTSHAASLDQHKGGIIEKESSEDQFFIAAGSQGKTDLYQKGLIGTRSGEHDKSG